VLEALHLFANHKVTGPAELALETARAVARTGRVRARFLSSTVKKTRYRDRWLQLLARERGVEEASELDGLRLAKHLSFSALSDVRRLARSLDLRPYDLIHCHLPNDHLLAAWAVEKTARRSPIVRTLYDGEAPPPSWRTRRTLERAAAIVCLSREAARGLREEHGIPAERVRALDAPIDTARFDPGRGVEAKRAALGIPEEAFCLGIVARMQTHRRFEVLLEAVKRAQVPDLRLLIVGRGTNQETVAREPVRALGLEGKVVFSGYQAGEDYVATLACMDAKVFLVPGSDGSCRAVREALSMGVPVIAARRGILPELVRNEETGLVVEDEPGPLALAIAGLARDRARLRGLSERARADALSRFSFETFGRTLADLYAEVSGGTKAVGGTSAR
jgi:glycosyltransferase involved in cell wall biosynthesis